MLLIGPDANEETRGNCMIPDSLDIEIKIIIKLDGRKTRQQVMITLTRRLGECIKGGALRIFLAFI